MVVVPSFFPRFPRTGQCLKEKFVLCSFAIFAELDQVVLEFFGNDGFGHGVCVFRSLNRETGSESDENR